MGIEPQMQDLIIVGGGELGRVIIEAARAQGRWNVIGFVDPQPCDETVRRLGIRRLGDDSALRFLTDENLVLGVGTIRVGSVRERIVTKINAPGRWVTVTHPFTCISPTAHIASGTVVLPGVVICSGAIISEHSIINLWAKIDHDVRVGRFVHVAPQAALGGGSTVEDNAYIGMGAVIRDHVTVSAGTLVGMGAVVSKQFPEGSTLVGIPAAPLIHH
jgi:acetyltransferase EpsM